MKSQWDLSDFDLSQADAISLAQDILSSDVSTSDFYQQSQVQTTTNLKQQIAHPLSIADPPEPVVHQAASDDESASKPLNSQEKLINDQFQMIQELKQQQMILNQKLKDLETTRSSDSSMQDEAKASMGQ